MVCIKEDQSCMVLMLKTPQRRAVYRNIVDELEKETAISKIAKEYGVTRQTVYRIKEDYISTNFNSI